MECVQLFNIGDLVAFNPRGHKVRSSDRRPKGTVTNDTTGLLEGDHIEFSTIHTKVATLASFTRFRLAVNC
jgi:hypothetical protein